MAELRVIRGVELAPGMVIADGAQRTPVRHVQPGQSCRGIHVNTSDCYNRGALVTIEVSDA